MTTRWNYCLGAFSLFCLLAVSALAQPVIDIQPASATACVGAPASFTVAATGTDPLSYQWYRGATQVGGNSATLVLAAVTPADAGDYTVVITDSAGSTTSAPPATLMVNGPTTVTSISTWPSGVTNCPASMVMLMANVQGVITSYQWKKDGVLMDGQIGQTLTIDSFSSADTGSYSVEAWGPCGNATNSIALYVVPAPVFTSQPVSQSRRQGDAVTLSAATVATINAAVAYQWYFNGVAIPEATSASYTLNGVKAADAGAYYVVASNCAGSSPSDAATLTVDPVSAVSFDFDTPGQFTNNFNVRPNTMGIAANLAVWGESATSGVGGSRCLDGVRMTGDDNSMIYWRSPFNFSSHGAVLKASVMVKVKNNPNNRATQLGFITHTNRINSSAALTTLCSSNTTFADLPGAAYMSYRISRQVGGMNHLFEYQQRREPGGSIITNMSSPVALVDGNWYRISVTFTNGRSHTTPYTLWAAGSVQDMGTNGTTPGSVVLSIPLTTIVNSNMTTNASVYLGLRAYEDGGPNYIDNLAGWMNDGPIAIAYPPQSVSLTNSRAVTFTVAVDGTPPYYYQWMKDGVDIAGATQPTYTIANPVLADAGEYSVRVTNATSTANSTAATLAFADLTPPAVVSVGSLNGKRIGVRFDELVEPVTATTPANYSVSGSAVSSVSLRPDGESVELFLATQLTDGFTVTVNGVQDLVGNAASGVSASSTVMGFEAYDVNGPDNIAPRTPGYTYSAKAGDFDVVAGGADMWNTADDGHLIVGPARTGDFEVKVRIQSIGRFHYMDGTANSRDDLARAGLQARESTNANSRLVQATAFPTDVGMPMGRNYWEASYRGTNGGIESAFAVNANSFDLGLRNSPAYPNAWVRLRRLGNWFIYSISSNSVDWVPKACQNLALSDTLYISLAASAHYDAPGYPITAEFRDLGDVSYPGAVMEAVTVTPALTNVPVLSAVTFSATPSVSGASARDVVYVWQRADGMGGWTNIPNAVPTNAYTTPVITALDTEELASWQFRCVAYLSGTAPVTSSVGAVTGLYDNIGPQISTVSYVPLGNALRVMFNEPVDPVQAGTVANWALTNNTGRPIALNRVEFYGETPLNSFVVLYPAVALTNANNYRVIASNMLDRGSPPNLTLSSYKLFNVTYGLITNSAGVASTAYPAPSGSVAIERYMNFGSGTTPGDLTNNSRFLNGYPDQVWYSNVMVLNRGMSNTADMYGARLSTYFIPPTNGFYHFYFRSDDGGYLAMNTNALCSEEPIAKVIANRPYLSDGGNYTSTGNGQAGGLYLVGGQPYYLEGGFKENLGGEGWMFTFRSQIDPSLPPNTEWASNSALYAAHPVLTGAVVVASMTPSSLTVTEGQFADFKVSGIVGARPMAVRWFKNGVLQPGDEPAARIGPFTLADTTVSCLVSNLFSKTTISSPVTVLPDTTAPAVASARGDGTLFRVYLQFNEWLDAVSAANPANYTIDGLTVHQAVLATNDLVVLYTSPQTEGQVYNINIAGVKDTSAAGNVANITGSFQAWIVGPGMVWREYYTNNMPFFQFQPVSSVRVLTNNPDFIYHAPNRLDVTNLFELSNWPFPQPSSSNFYGAVLSGFFLPPQSGHYTFFMQHDDGGEFLIYTNNPDALNPAGLVSGMLADSAVQSTFAEGANALSAYLQAGQRYYVEGRLKQATGGNYFRLGVRFPTDWAGSIPTASVGKGFIAAAGDPTASILPFLDIAVQPVNSPDTIENQFASFLVEANNSANSAMGYQWQKFDSASSRWVDVVGAATSNALIPVSLADDGAQFRCKVGVPGRVVYSDPVSVHVLADTVCPTIAAVTGDVLSNVVVVTFSEKVTPATATNINNYSFSQGFPVLEAMLQPNGKTVALILGADISAGTYSVSVRDVTDLAATPNTICPNPSSSGSFTAPWPVAQGYVQIQLYQNLGPTWYPSNYLLSVLTGHPKFPYQPDLTLYTNISGWPQTSPNLDTYGLRMTGLIVPPVTGNYSFFVNADDTARLTLSPLSDPAQGVVIINAEGGFCAACNRPASYSPPVALVAGKPYSFELLMTESTGVDYAWLQWRVPGASVYTNIYSTNLAFSVNPDSVQLTTTLQPQSQTILEGRTASFSVSAMATVGVPAYQWQQYDAASGSWVDIPGATATNYTTGYLCAEANGAAYRAMVGLGLVNGQVSRTNLSEVATVTVLPDTEPPHIVSVGSLDGNSIGVVFSEPVRMDVPGFRWFDNWEIWDANIIANLYFTNADGSCLTDEFGNCIMTYYNYPVGDVVAWPDTNALYTDKVILKLAGLFSPNVSGPFSVHCYYAVDTACQQNAMEGTAEGLTLGLNLVDIGLPQPAGSAFCGTSNQVSVTAGGYDIWNTGDQFTYLVRQVEGDFDARVTMVAMPDPPSSPLPNAWAKGGLMLRGAIEGTDGYATNSWLGAATNSKMAFIAATPTNGQHTFASSIRYQDHSLATDFPGVFRSWIYEYPVQVRMVREGGTITTFSWSYETNIVTDSNSLVNTTNLTGYWQTNGVASTTNWPGLMYLGLATTSHAQNNGVNATYENFKLIEKPVITGQPISLVATSGQTVSLSVAVNSPEEGNPLRYQWFLNGAAVPGANSPTLALPNIGLANAGTYSVVVRNSAGLVQSSTAQVTVYVAPAITVQPVSATAACGGSATFGVVAVGDGTLSYQWQLNGINIEGATNDTLTVNSVNHANTGPYAVVITSEYGMVASTAVNVNLSDGGLIVLDCPSNMTVECGLPVSFTVSGTDLCGGPVSVICVPPSGQAFGRGTTIVNCLAIGDGTSNSCSFTVTGIDSIPPVVVLHGSEELRMECHSTYQELGATAQDQCAGIVPVTIVGNLDVNTPGRYTLAYQATDPANNTGVAVRVIIVHDTLPPTILCPPAITVNGASQVPPPSAVILSGEILAHDTCSAVTISWVGDNPEAKDLPCRGTILRSYRATDISGNTADCVHHITVNDGENPVISCPADLLRITDAGKCYATLQPGVATATDDCSAEVTGVRDDGKPLTEPYPVGVTKITWTAADAAGNTAGCVQTITVTDTENPVVSCPPDLDQQADPGKCEAVLQPGTATAADNCSATVAGVRADGKSLTDPYPVGETLIEWTAKDTVGNTARCQQVIKVRDAEPPRITGCPEGDIVGMTGSACDQTVSWVPPVASDNCGDVLLVSDHQPGDSFPVGVTTVTYTAQDAALNSATCSFQVIVVDDTAPLLGDCPLASPFLLHSGLHPVGPVYAHDNCGLDTQACLLINLVDTSAVGTNLVFFQAVDVNGNSSLLSCGYQVQYAPVGALCQEERSHETLQPINADGTSVFRQGSIVPVKFRVCDANGVSIGIDGVVSNFRLIQKSAGTVSDVDEEVFSTTPDSAFRWESAEQQWVFNISTRTLEKNATYYYRITLNDGTYIDFQFGLK